MATYTLTHSRIACLMTVTSDALPKPVDLMLMRPGVIAALPGGRLNHSPEAWESLPPQIRHEAEQRFAALFAIEPAQDRTPAVEAFRAAPLTVEA